MSESPPQPSPQIGIVLVTHGSFGVNLCESAQLILGPQDNVSSVSLPPHAGGDEIIGEIKVAVAAGNRGSGVLVLTDLFGGTPTTLSLSLLKDHDIEVVAGVNLPMLIKALQSRYTTLGELAETVREAGRKGIVVAGQMLRRRTS
ncbi:MAG: PTS sugar transporter subunit IIA [Proteobacteria bacterium]|nr:PTS sugar transporter subunit IIA [Pseudomonadota bacterium]MBU1612087.1 PTS sugar transporter subunit IIA [Pseudomonadota bacterium]